MPSSNTLADIPLRPANMAAPASVIPRPAPFTSAMFLSFDADAESAWTSKDPQHAARLATMSFGGFEARVGTPKLLHQLGPRATFFINGWSVDAHPPTCESILHGGHEIGHHGYHHLMPDPGVAHIEEELERGFDALKRVLGVVHPVIGRLSESSRMICGLPLCATASPIPLRSATMSGRIGTCWPTARPARSNCQ